MHLNSDFQDIFSKNIKLCRFVGSWSQNMFKNVVRLFYLNFVAYGAIAHFLLADRDIGYPSDFIEDIALTLSSICLSTTIINFEVRREEIIALTEAMSRFKIFGIPCNFNRRKKILNTIITCYNISILLGTVYYVSMSTILKSKCLEQNLQLDKFRICGVFAQFPQILEVTESPQNEILNAIQSISAIHITLSSGIIYSFMFNISEHIIIRINYLNKLFRQLDGDYSQETKRNHLRKCIKYHNHIIELVDKLNYCFMDTLLAAITIDTLVIGTIIVQFLTENSFSAFLHFLAWVVTLFTLSVTGQRIYDESLLLQDAIYNLKWYNENCKYQKDLHLIIIISQRNLCLKTGKFGIMFYPTFMKVMQTSYSFVAVIQQKL